MIDALKQLKNRLSLVPAKSWVLMYHRIAAEAIDPWDICVRPELFDQHLHWLKNNAHVKPLSQLIEEWNAGKLIQGSVAITLDDGYLDNFTVAMPLLEKHNLHATFFLTAGNILDRRPYWWDELQYIFLVHPVLPQHFHLKIKDKLFVADLGKEQKMTAGLSKRLRLWKGSCAPSCRRAELYFKIWTAFKSLTHEEQNEYLRLLKIWCQSDIYPPAPMSVEQVLQLSKSDLFEVGVHTMTHPALAVFDKALQKDEILQARDVLADIIKKNPTFCAYPYGNYNKITCGIVAEGEFSAAFTTECIPLARCRNKFEIGRKAMSNKKLGAGYYNSEKAT